MFPYNLVHYNPRVHTMSRLSLSKVEDLINGQDIRQVKRIFASERKIKYLDDLRYTINSNMTSL